ncbi:MAG: PQQ-binding-like beta-propeller repeat protein [Bacteroidetes bacterium]|nr:PQQ-binding-like beta-propeller repeat protein [Bacteroidota bacterium]
MRYLLLPVMLGIILFGCHPNNGNHTGMFRDNPQHNTTVTTTSNIVLDTKAWAFASGAPVRSTALIDEQNIFFGNTRGDFFAVDKITGKAIWQYHTGYAINSSAACSNGMVYFSDNEQTLYALDEQSGTLQWKTKLGNHLPYPWRFDYYQSSPIIVKDNIIIGSDDGNLYTVNAKNGTVVRTFKTKGLVRTTPALYKNLLVFGDTEGDVYAIDAATNKQQWLFTINGAPLNLDTLGFDRKAILAAPVIAADKIIFGARDGFLYCLDAITGKALWTVDHHISWIISTVAIKDSFVVTGTSDGRFVQAVNLNTGKEIWKYHTPLATWSSPLIQNNRVYEGCYDGQLFCLDLVTGKRISQFATNGIVYASPVISDSLLYIGSDDGNLYALTGSIPENKTNASLLVYYDKEQLKNYFNNGGDVRIKNYLLANGFTLIGTDTLPRVMKDSAIGKTIVFATDYFPKVIYENKQSSILRQFLDNGGRIIIAGNNPLFFNMDETKKQMLGLTNRRIDSVLNIDYGPTDTRAFGGLFTGFANAKGKSFGLPDYWVSNFGVAAKQVDIVLGENENGLASAFIKKYEHGGAFIQIWLNNDTPQQLDALIKLAERRLW